jgi:hypothetical protein
VVDNTFLQDYIQLHDDTEIPDLFALWSGVAGISAALGRRTWLDMGTFTIYPNMFIVFIATSGRCRKSTAIMFIRRILRGLLPPPNLLSQKMTPEALIEALKTSQDTPTQDTQATPARVRLVSSEGFVIVDELSNFLNRKSYEAGLGDVLISLFDCDDDFSYRTRGKGLEKLTDCCLGLLGGTTFKRIREVLPEDAIGGGLVSRMIFVYVDRPKPPVPRPTFSDEKKALLERAVRKLQRIMMVKGRMTLSSAAVQLYDEDYIRYFNESSAFDDDLTSGYASRRYVHLLKLAMIFTAAEETLVIERRHLEGAEALLRQSEVSLEKVINMITTTGKGQVTDFVHNKVAQAVGGITRTDLMRAVSHRLDSQELQGVMETLMHAGRIRCVSAGRGIVYQVKEQG